MKGKFLIIITALVFVAAACNRQSASKSGGEVQSGSVEIQMTTSGFNPSEVTVKKRVAVVFKNTDDKPHWPASNPHPTHTDYPGFDPKQGVASGSSWTFTFDQVGIWEFHDHLNPGQRGLVTVVE